MLVATGGIGSKEKLDVTGRVPLLLFVNTQAEAVDAQPEALDMAGLAEHAREPQLLLVETGGELDLFGPNVEGDVVEQRMPVLVWLR